MSDYINTEEFRDYLEPEPPKHSKKPPLRENNTFQILTFGVLMLAIIWSAMIALVPRVHPSRLTLTFFLACLIFYAGEYICWKRPKLKRREKRAPWRDRA